VREEDNFSVSKAIENALSIPLVVSGSTNVRPTFMRNGKINQKLGIISFN